MSSQQLDNKHHSEIAQRKKALLQPAASYIRGHTWVELEYPLLKHELEAC